MQRSTNGSNGKTERGSNGQFLPGNSGGPGNPLAKKTSQLRAALVRSVTSRDFTVIVKKLVTMAKDGDVQAAKVLLDRLLGPVAVGSEGSPAVTSIQVVTQDDWYGTNVVQKVLQSLDQRQDFQEFARSRIATNDPSRSGDNDAGEGAQ